MICVNAMLSLNREVQNKMQFTFPCDLDDALFICTSFHQITSCQSVPIYFWTLIPPMLLRFHFCAIVNSMQHFLIPYRSM